MRDYNIRVHDPGILQRSRIFIFHNTIRPDFEQTQSLAVNREHRNFIFLFFSYSLTRDLGACSIVHVFRLPDINSITDGTVAAQRTKLSASAKFAGEFVR